MPSGAGWKFGALYAKISSNPTLFIARFGHGERQRPEMLLCYVHAPASRYSTHSPRTRLRGADRYLFDAYEQEGKKMQAPPKAIPHTHVGLCLI
jgi:hypothetical protein